MAPKFFIGFDISKLTIDVAVLSTDNKHLGNYTIANTPAGLAELFPHFLARHKCTLRNSFLCAEETGSFSSNLADFAISKKATLCMESPLRLKRSVGIVRGKSDPADALMIARYGQTHYKTLTIWKPARECIQRLRALLTLRRRLIKVRTMLTQGEKVTQLYKSLKNGYGLDSYYQNTINAIVSDIKSVDDQMKFVIEQDPNLVELFGLITSIPRVGSIIAIHVITATNEFINISTAKKFACYCGIAPFPRQSGTSLVGKSRVSHIANKEIKRLLHLAVMGYAKNEKHFLGRYYKRKIAEGKNGMSVLNAVRNKLIHRIFACVISKQPYVDH